MLREVFFFKKKNCKCQQYPKFIIKYFFNVSLVNIFIKSHISSFIFPFPSPSLPSYIQIKTGYKTYHSFSFLSFKDSSLLPSLLATYSIKILLRSLIIQVNIKIKWMDSGEKKNSYAYSIKEVTKIHLLSMDWAKDGGIRRKDPLPLFFFFRVS